MTGARGNGRIFDLDAAAAEAAAREGEAVPFPFTFKGETYAVPPSSSWSLRAQRLLGEGELAAALVLILGDETTRALEDAGIKLGDIERLFTAVGAADGVSDGNPNPGPSGRPARPVSART